ncbi:helix-turn-helix domain-containing protein [Streptomyces lutosisoli]|uniref:Helix-turn-helix domain-containing protein n=1 Tax=Streptomyces lutosisoli TaxID=2665721 RepID=A0ABW2VYW3_9ACTN
MKPPLSVSSGIGRRLREQRRRRGLNQQDLASEDISVSYVSLIETGKRMPSPAILEALADRVGCSVEYLRTGRDDNRGKELRLKLAFADIALRNGAYGEALQSYAEVLESAPLLDAPVLRRAKLGQALTMERLGRTEPALHLLHALYESPDTTPGSAEWAQLAIALCRCYRAAGDLDMSIEIGEKATRTLDDLGLEMTDDHVQLGTALMGCYQLRGNLPRAHMLAARLVETADSTGSRATRGSAYWNAGLVAHSRGRTSEALALIERALVLMAQTDNVRHQAMLKGSYGILLLESHTPEPARALRLLKEARRDLAEVGTALERALAEMGVAWATLRCGRAEEAVTLAERALGLFSAQDTVEVVEARFILGEALFATGESGRGESAFQEAVRQLGRLTPSRKTSKLWRRLGDFWQHQGRSAEALGAYQQALAGVGLHPLPAPEPVLMEHLPAIEPVPTEHLPAMEPAPTGQLPAAGPASAERLPAAEPVLTERQR